MVRRQGVREIADEIAQLLELPAAPALDSFNELRQVLDKVVAALDRIASLRDQLGAGRLMWGSDMPNVERFCTYKQSLDYVRKYCPFLTAREKDLILGDTCAAFYRIARD